MATTEQLDWSQPDKSDKKKKESPGPKFSNPPIKGFVEHDLPLNRVHEGHMRMEEKVLPDILFQELLKGETDRNKHLEEEPKIQPHDSLAHVPIPVEQGRPPAARAEHPVYDPFQAEHTVYAAEHTAETLEDEDDDDDDDENKEEEQSKPRVRDADEVIAVPLDEAHEGSIPTKQADAVERLIERLEDDTEAAEATAAVTAEAAAEPEPAAVEASAASGPFMPLESEPDGEGAAGGGGNRPPVPPSEGASSSEPEPYNRYTSYQPSFAQPVPRAETYAAALPDNYATERMRPKSQEADLRAKITWGITGFVVGNYLATRRQRRFEAEADKRMQEANQRLAEVSGDNARLQQRIERLPAAAPAPARYEQPQPYAYDQAQVPMPTTHFEQPVYPQQPLQEQYAQVATYDTPRTEQIAVTGQPVRYEQPLQQQFEQPLAGGMFNAPPSPELQQNMPMPGPAELARQQLAAEQMPQVVGEDGRQVVLEPGQRLERRGWYSVVVDEHGREVPGAIQYGGAFHSEQRQEQAPVVFSTADADAANQDPAQRQQAMGMGGSYGGGASTYVGGGYGPTAVGSNGMLGSGQVDPSHELQPGHPAPVDVNRRLSQRQNPILATLANPVLWLAFALLVIAYFIAALI